ncbi:hypothetical protein JCM18909_450 [Cutibacterium acnes JCM 18909]|nr:hypothetical protein JCM18909_450 [Cutibacterium acnes JCM 18909]
MHFMNGNSTFSHLGHEISMIFLCFFSTHRTSSKSNSLQLLGVSRRCARRGSHTITSRSLPTSDHAPMGVVIS